MREAHLVFCLTLRPSHLFQWKLQDQTVPQKRAVCLLIVFTQYNYTTDYTVLTAHWQFVKMLLKAEISEQIESNSTQILQELSSPLGTH